MQQIEINLGDKTEAEKQVRLVQKAIDDLVGVCTEQKSLLLKNAEHLLNAEETINQLQNSTIDLADAVKAIYSMLQIKKDLFKGDAQMEELLTSLATFVVSSGAIKLGVLSNKKQEALNVSSNQ